MRGTVFIKYVGKCDRKDVSNKTTAQQGASSFAKDAARNLVQRVSSRPRGGWTRWLEWRVVSQFETLLGRERVSTPQTKNLRLVKCVLG